MKLLILGQLQKINILNDSYCFIVMIFLFRSNKRNEIKSFEMELIEFFFNQKSNSLQNLTLHFVIIFI